MNHLDANPVANSAWLEPLFPFYVLVSPELNVLAVGASLSRIVPVNPLGRPLAEMFTLTRPKMVYAFSSLVRKNGKMFVGHLTHSNIEYRGQLFVQEPNLLLLGRPRFGSTKEMNAAGVSAIDFPANDLSIDLLLLKEAQREQISELKGLTIQLRNAAQREVELCRIEKLLENDLNNAADVRIRLSSDLSVLSVSVVRQEFLSQPAEEVIGQHVSLIFPAINGAELVENLGENETLAIDFCHKAEHGTFDFDGRFTRSMDSGFLLLLHDKTKANIARREKETLEHDLRMAARKAGMAEVATGILHNVGNILNSVSVSANLLQKYVNASPVDKLLQASRAINEHIDNPGKFLAEDSKGRHLPRLLEALASAFQNQHENQIQETRQLLNNIDHIKRIVAMQQSIAKGGGGVQEVIIPAEVFESAVKFEQTNSDQEQFDLQCQFDAVPPIQTDKHQVLQILINLIRNAKQAYNDYAQQNTKVIRLRLFRDRNFVCFQVCDNAVGISPEHLTAIFQHGFTTRHDGHGFGLHASANSAQSLGGSLTAESQGVGLGAEFTLRLPINAK